MSDSDTASEVDFELPVAKRRRISNSAPAQTSQSRSRSISPPPLRRGISPQGDLPRAKSSGGAGALSNGAVNAPTLIPSPFQLTQIRDLRSEDNVDTVSLKDILGDPLIKETWQFNYLIDLDFLMFAIDEDVRRDVKVNVVHGFWKKEEKQDMLEQAARYPNLKLITAYMPEIFGTHHTKMMVNFRHDDTAEIVIHTANMIARDWKNMSQAVWRSPLLPLLPQESQDGQPDSPIATLGTGMRFRQDFFRYLSAYEERTKSLVDQLKHYDFSAIRAALIGCAPCKQKERADQQSRSTRFGWLGLKDVLRNVPTSTRFEQRPVIVAQVSSIATLGAAPTWIDSFFNVLNLSTKAFPKAPISRLVFPNADEIRRSLDGYSAGGSIHTKIQSKTQQKQVDYLKPKFCHWAGDGPGLRTAEEQSTIREAGRRRAAPHIKTYIRFSNSDMKQIDWAMVTSANLSTQAWGALANKDGDVKISSYELGVIVWPALFDDQDKPGTLNPDDSTTPGRNNQRKTIMVPTFRTDTPSLDELEDANVKTVVGFRMPYDLPLVRYKAQELPWCATASYEEPDWTGRGWQGYSPVKKAGKKAGEEGNVVVEQEVDES